MDQKRRDFLDLTTALSLAAAGSILLPWPALAKEWDGSLLTTRTYLEAAKALGGDLVVESSAITVAGPEMVDSGYIVPVSVESRLEGTDLIVLVVQKNPTPVVGVFKFPDGTQPAINTRIKMGETSSVYAVVRANNNYYVASTIIKVRAGGSGCG
jgi:sulfur-oxidizing protein SoxY